MDSQWIKVKGIVKKGHQVASGIGKNSPYPQGSVVMQMPFFLKLGLDITPFFLGTLNVSIHPYQFMLKHPQYTFKQVKWNQNSPPEDFSFSWCRLDFEAIEYPSLIYYPHPETKPAHFQDSSTLEILAPPITNIRYGNEVQLAINLREIQVFRD